MVLPGAAGMLGLLWSLAGPGAAARAGERLAGPVPAVVTRVVDGDTLEVRARIWLGQELAIRVRLAGIDAPEAGSSCAQERALALRARAFLTDRLTPDPGGPPPVVRLRDIRNGKYAGRVLARVEVPPGQDLGRALLAAGLARRYDGGRRAAWCATAEP
jgi:endonuclease YncB( thermonuclease family)